MNRHYSSSRDSLKNFLIAYFDEIAQKIRWRSGRNNASHGIAKKDLHSVDIAGFDMGLDERNIMSLGTVFDKVAKCSGKNVGFGRQKSIVVDKEYIADASFCDESMCVKQNDLMVSLFVRLGT